MKAVMDDYLNRTEDLLKNYGIINETLNKVSYDEAFGIEFKSKDADYCLLTYHGDNFYFYQSDIEFKVTPRELSKGRLSDLVDELNWHLLMYKSHLLNKVLVDKNKINITKSSFKGINTKEKIEEENEIRDRKKNKPNKVKSHQNSTKDISTKIMIPDSIKSDFDKPKKEIETPKVREVKSFKKETPNQSILEKVKRETKVEEVKSTDSLQDSVKDFLVNLVEDPSLTVPENLSKYTKSIDMFRLQVRKFKDLGKDCSALLTPIVLNQVISNILTQKG